MKKQLVLLIDEVTGEVGYENPDELNIFEVLGLMESVKMLVFEEGIKDE